MIVYPVHPRVISQIEDSFLEELQDQMILTRPLSYIEFIRLLNQAKGCITDSGGLQEETAALNIPCFTIRNTTERPMSLEAGTNVLLGTSKESIKENLRNHTNEKSMGEMRNAPSPYGNGKAAQQIVNILEGQ